MQIWCPLLCTFVWVFTVCPSAHTASTARHLYLRGGVGVGSMTKIYGGRKRNGVCPSHFSRGSKNVARKVLQSLESLKMVEKDPNGWALRFSLWQFPLARASLVIITRGKAWLQPKCLEHLPGKVNQEPIS